MSVFIQGHWQRHQARLGHVEDDHENDREAQTLKSANHPSGHSVLVPQFIQYFAYRPLRVVGIEAEVREQKRLPAWFLTAAVRLDSNEYGVEV